MNLQTLSSGSQGNCYLLNQGGSFLIVEAGIRSADILDAVDFDINKVAGCLISHEHQDHCKGAKGLAKYGIGIWGSAGTLNAIGSPGQSMTPLKQYQIGQFTVMGFDVQHDTAEPFGFLIHHPECGTIVFLTDSYYCKYRFPDVNHFIIEANYCEDIIMQKDCVYRNRVLKSHMSIQTAIKFLKAHDLTKCESITLIHLSNGNSDEQKFKDMVVSSTGVICNVV